MKLTIMTPKSAILALAVVVLSVTAVQAVPTTYVYTGNPFTDVTGPYSTSDFVTAMVTLASPLAANMPLTQVIPLAFSLSDGLQTITNSTAGSSTFHFATGPTGMITGWELGAQVGDGFPDAVIFTFGSPFAPGVGGDQAGFDQNGPNPGFAFNDNSPGTWTKAAVPDAGSSLAVLSLSLTALGVAARQFKRGAA